MTPENFVRKREADWQRLNALLDRKSHQLSTNEVAEIGRLYRATTSDLAVAQRDFPTHDVAYFLNQLTARTHATLYRGNLFEMSQVGHFFRVVIPRNFRQTWAFTFVAALMLFLPAIAAGVSIAFFPETLTTVMPVSMQQAPAGGNILTMVENHEPWFYFDGDEQPAASAMITTNNIQVSIMAFAGGMTAGFFTIYILVFNGTMLGGLLGYAANQEFYDLHNFVIAHGVIELSMICVAGGAGLMFGWAILRPGKHTRADALFLAGRRAIISLITCALFLVIAGLIEGFISPIEDLAPIVKWSVGIISGLMMYSYFFLAGYETD